MRLIDADALMKIVDAEMDRVEEEILDAKEKPTLYTDDFRKFKSYTAVGMAHIAQDILEAPTIDAVPVETICEMFGNEAPCNYGLFGVSVDDFMMSKCGKWCEDNCDKVPYTECWQKFFEAIEKWRKQNG